MSIKTSYIIVNKRNNSPYTSIIDLVKRTGLSQAALRPLAAANALSSISGHRHFAYWQVAGVEQTVDLWNHATFKETTPLLKRPGDWDNTLADYASCGLTLKKHPLELLRSEFAQQGICTAERLAQKNDGQFVRVAGLVLNRQRPGTASGVVFITLEDETGHINLVIWPKIAEARRKTVLQSKLMFAAGQIQIESEVIHLIVHHLRDDSHRLGGLQTKSRDFQ